MAAPVDNACISVRGLSKTFGGRTVLRDVDLDVFPGQVHALIGQNGSGKSTLIKILASVPRAGPGRPAPVEGASRCRCRSPPPIPPGSA